MCPRELKMGRFWDTQNAGMPSACLEFCLMSNFPALLGAFPMAIPTLPSVWCCPWPCLERALINAQGLLKPDHVLEIMFNLFSFFRATKPWEMCQRWRRDSVPYCPCLHFQVPPWWKPLRVMRLSNTHSPFLSLFPKTNQIWEFTTASHPRTLTLHHSNGSHPLPLPQRWY